MTGATGGIGRAISELLLAEGATVHLTDLDPERGASLAATLGDRARFHVLDVTDEAGWAAVTERIEESDGPLTTLVNCAGAALRRPLVDTSLCGLPPARRAQPHRHLPRPPHGGHGTWRTAGRSSTSPRSTASCRPPSSGRTSPPRPRCPRSPGSPHSSSPTRGITVNAVCPGSIDTEITDRPDFAGLDWDAYVRTIPLNRRGGADEVAQAVLYLASDESRYVTGTNLVIDGGIAAGRRTP